VRLGIATRNDHKLRELGRVLGDVVLEPLPAGVSLPPEVGDTFAANAVGKARAAAGALGRAAIGDDSGIEAEALGGAPGIRSARFAGPGADDARNLAKLREQAPVGSRLRYVCVIAYAEPGGEERTFEGSCTGRLAPAPRGTGGFGYDPVFVPDDIGDERTMAELSDAEKDAISHRGRAARALREWLASAERAPDRRAS
jgi:XTP/dITP diphosphohydrolase